ncbi:hypothetical protein ON010_g3302 [Phytophthora cinnamomi]|nr:hypothetical protein ON010_g3302 [Phytophthora cinnamomi]
MGQLGLILDSVPQRFEELDAALPWLSKCAAAFDPHAAYVSRVVSDTVKSCLATLESIDEGLSSADGWSNFCPVVKDTGLPCIAAVLREPIMGTCYSAGGRDPDSFGDSLDVAIEKHVQHLAHVACAERTFTNLAGALTKERCDYSIMNSLTFINQEDDAKTPSLLNLAEIPNDQMCSAYAGEDFANTKGERVALGFGTFGVDTMGIRLQPLDALT